MVRDVSVVSRETRLGQIEEGLQLRMRSLEFVPKAVGA